MRHTALAAILLCGLLLAGCSSDNAAELFETAKFEELQNNKEHARQLYQEIIRKFPDSAYAQQAQQRLSEMQ